ETNHRPAERPDRLVTPGQRIVEVKRHGPQRRRTPAAESNPEPSGCQRKEAVASSTRALIERLARSELELEPDLEAAAEIALGIDLQRPAAVRSGRLVGVDSQVVLVQDVLDVQ